MAFLPIRRPTRLNQPNGDGIDWSNPLTRGLVALYNGSLNEDVISGTSGVISGTAYATAASRGGVGSFFSLNNIIGTRRSIRLTKTIQELGISGVTPSTVFGYACMPTATVDSPVLFTLGINKTTGNQVTFRSTSTQGELQLSPSPDGGAVGATTGLSAGTPFTFAMQTKQGGTFRLWINGVDITGWNSANIADGEIHICGGGIWDNGQDVTDKPLMYLAIFNRDIGANTIKSLSANPWQVFL